MSNAEGERVSPLDALRAQVVAAIAQLDAVLATIDALSARPAAPSTMPGPMHQPFPYFGGTVTTVPSVSPNLTTFTTDAAGNLRRESTPSGTPMDNGESR